MKLHSFQFRGGLINYKSLVSILVSNLISIVAINVQAASAETSGNAAKPAKSTEFAFNLFRREAVNAKKNTVISPFSAYMALAMTVNGAGGATKSQMAQTLGVTEADFSHFNANNHKILQELTETSDAELEIANALYADKAYPFRQPFLDLCQKEYMAESHNEDFSDPATVGKINKWCDQKTHGKIKAIFSQFQPEDKLVLLNSIYFKGSWQHSFEPSDTKQENFKLLNGSVKKVPMMHTTNNFEYFKGDGFEALTLPYMGRRQQVLYVFLPAPGTNFANFLASFTAKNWSSRLSGLRTTRVDVSMPKYKIEYSDELKNSLIAMGMSNAFGGTADFGALCENPTRISRVIQKTYVEVDETGTEAAAVTAVVSSFATAMAPREPSYFKVDRPFVMAIADCNTNEILFLGSIVDPTSK